MNFSDAAIDRLLPRVVVLGSIIFGLLLAAPMPSQPAASANEPPPLRINQLQCIGTHNSYKGELDAVQRQLLSRLAPDQLVELDYQHVSLPDQLERLGLRLFELDLYRDPEGGRFAQPAALSQARELGIDVPPFDPEGMMLRPGTKVLHVPDIDYRTQVQSLTEALEQYRDWSDARPDHWPIFVLLELKSQSVGLTQPLAWDAPSLLALEAEILGVLPRERWLTPADVQGPAPTLRQAVLESGWPTLESTRGKFVLLLDNEDAVRQAYLDTFAADQPGLMFVSLDADHPRAAWMKRNDPVAQFDHIQQLVRQGFLVRTRADSGTHQARQGDTHRRERAVASGAQLISTDYPEPDPRWGAYQVRLAGGRTTGLNPLTAPKATSPRPPNLIWLMADDLGYGELGCYGQQVIRTPRLDQMAAEGLRMTQFYAGATVCAPSRSVLMTGLHHGHTPVRGNAGRDNPEAQALGPDDMTVAKLLQQAGYRTALIGKWGLGDHGRAETGLPLRQGFDHFLGYLNQVHAHNPFPDHLWRGSAILELPNSVEPIGDRGGGHATLAQLFADDYLTDQALSFISQSQAEPFFLYWNPVLPHANNERTFQLGNGAHVPDFGPYTLEDWPDQDRGHAAMITRLDSYVGRLLDHLRLLGIDQDTCVIFTSDNGPHNESRHNLERFQPSGPLRGIKRSLHEGGIRVPTLCWWPGRVAAGQTSGHVGYFGDYLATAAELAGAETPPQLDSISFVPTLLGIAEQPRHRFLYWEFHEGGFQQAALMDGRWKGIRAGTEGQLKLFDLHSDLAEQHDVSAEHPQLVAALRQYLDQARSPNPHWPVP